MLKFVPRTPLTIAARTESPVKRAKPDTHTAYIRMYEERAERYSNGEKDLLAPLAFAAIRCFNRLEINAMECDEALCVEQMTSSILAALTPRQLLYTFPPTKVFNGHKYQSKDYFYTMEAVRAYPLDEPIGQENLFDFAWDYVNRDISDYMVKRMGVIDLLLRSQGKLSALESLFAEQGITPRYLKADPDGKEYLYDPDTGTKTRVYPKRPFKIVSRSIKQKGVSIQA